MPAKRTIEVGAERRIIFQFKQGARTTADMFRIRIEFEQGCVVELAP